MVPVVSSQDLVSIVSSQDMVPVVSSQDLVSIVSSQDMVPVVSSQDLVSTDLVRLPFDSKSRNNKTRRKYITN
jgi:hypothetical protein